MGVVEDHLLTIARTSQAVGDTRYLQEFRGQVEEVSGARLKVKRLDQGEAFWAPLVASSHKPREGDWVRGYQFHGQAIILGADGKASDKDVPALDLQKLARDGTQPMTGALAVQRALAGANKAMQALKATDGDEVQIQLTTSGALRLFNQTTGQILADFRRNGQLDATLLAGAVGNREIADYAVGGFKLAGNSVGSRVLAFNAVSTGHIQDYHVVNQKIDTNAVNGRAIAGGAVNTGHLVADAVTNAKLADYAVGGFKLADNSVGSRVLGASGVGYSHIAPIISGDNSPTGDSSARQNKALRKIAGSGSGLAAASGDHTHSIGFKTMTRSLRRAILKMRENVRREDAEFEDLKALVLALAHLLLDDEDVSAEEREERLKNDPGFRRKFLQENKHDYAEGEMFRKKSKDGYLLNAHPDIAPYVEDSSG